MTESAGPVSLYLIVPPSDISRTKPLVRLVLNQIGRRLTEELESKRRKHRLLLMLDEFPALGRLDFFEQTLAFLAGYGIRSFLVAQSLNQIERSYGPNNTILDNCHVRVSFATNDERTARRVSNALGTATEFRDARNYAGHRLSPWLGHLMVSRQETARPLLTPGEVMQLPLTDAIVLVSGVHPIRAKKARYYEDRRLRSRVLPSPSRRPPSPTAPGEGGSGGRAANPTDDWSRLPPPAPLLAQPAAARDDDDAANGGIRREPKLPVHEAIDPPQREKQPEAADPEPDDEDAVRARILAGRARAVARQAAMDPDDGIAL